MRIYYALTKAEIVANFLRGLAKSPQLLIRVVVYSLVPGVVSLLVSGAFSQGFTAHVAISLFLWMAGSFFLMLVLLFLTGKTAERTLTVSDDGISTSIGRLSGQVPWKKVAEVRDAGNHVLIMGRSGNSFFVPNRAFSTPDEKKHFLAELSRWRSLT